MSDEPKSSAAFDAFQAKIDAGEPVISYFIEPPLKISLEENVVHIDAPCMIFGGTGKAAVVRITLSAGAAKGMKQFFAALEVADDGPVPGSAMQ